jgi:hypothetical protein
MTGGLLIQVGYFSDHYRQIRDRHFVIFPVHSHKTKYIFIAFRYEGKKGK